MLHLLNILPVPYRDPQPKDEGSSLRISEKKLVQMMRTSSMDRRPTLSSTVHEWFSSTSLSCRAKEAIHLRDQLTEGDVSLGAHGLRRSREHANS